MADPDFQREVTRSGGTVRVDLTEAANVSEADTDAIVATAKGSSPEDEVRVVQIDGPALEGSQAPDGLPAAIRSLTELANTYGKELIVSPI